MLHDKFIGICESIKDMNEDEPKARARSMQKVEWKLPYTIVAFCANRIKELIADPELVKGW